MTATYTLEEAQALLPEARRRIAQAQALLADLRAMLQALLDFPARAVLDGTDIEVLLCWRDDEDAIAYYHPAASGYRGREPIAMLDRV